jgi:hypothetical protein
MVVMEQRHSSRSSINVLGTRSSQSSSRCLYAPELASQIHQSTSINNSDKAAVIHSALADTVLQASTANATITVSGTYVTATSSASQRVTTR